MSEDNIQKVESHKGLVLPASRERGQPLILTSKRLIEDSKKDELSIHKRLCTFDTMYYDDAVSSGYNATQTRVHKSLASLRYVGTGSIKSEAAANFINYNLHNMSYGSWWQATGDMITATKYGWSDLNIVSERKNYGPYKGMVTLRKLSPRDQKSVYGWLWNENRTEWLGFVQCPSVKQRKPVNLRDRFNDGLTLLSVPTERDGTKWPVLRREQLIHSAYNTTLNNPQGDSPFMHCFDAWYEKKLIEAFEIAGVSKDLQGIPILRIPSELAEKANQPDLYPEAVKEYEALQRNVIDLSKGQEAFLVLNSDRDETGNYHVEFDLLGVQGGTKNYSTADIINRKDKAIYNSFDAAYMILGQDGVGSNALSSNQITHHGHRVERDIMMYVDFITTQLVPRLLAVNGEYLDWKDMPKPEWDDWERLTYDEAGKFIQRTASVNKLTPEIYKHLLKDARLPQDGVEDLNYIEDSGQSRAGDGMATAGEGTAEEYGGNDKSVSNNENGGVNKTVEALNKQFVAEKGTDRIIDVQTGTCVNESDLDKYGNFK